jgi:hypothetical protein
MGNRKVIQFTTLFTTGQTKHISKVGRSDHDPHWTIVAHMLHVDQRLQTCEKWLAKAEANSDDVFLASSSVKEDLLLYKRMILDVTYVAREGQRLLKRRNRLIDWYHHLHGDIA